jgi:hypothetical protein
MIVHKHKRKQVRSNHIVAMIDKWRTVLRLTRSFEGCSIAEPKPESSGSHLHKGGRTMPNARRTLHDLRRTVGSNLTPLVPLRYETEIGPPMFRPPLAHLPARGSQTHLIHLIPLLDIILQAARTWPCGSLLANV